MDLPESLQLARTINQDPPGVLAQLEASSPDLIAVLSPILLDSGGEGRRSRVDGVGSLAKLHILRYLSLPALLYIVSLPSCTGLFPPDSSNEDKSRFLSELIDWQRDWLVEGCPVELKDEYLVNAFEGDGAAWSSLKDKFQLVLPQGSELVLEGETSESKGLPCKSLQDFQSKLKAVSGGLFEKLDWSNIALGGGAVLGILTGQIDDPSFKDSDFDLFLYGLEPGQLIPKIASIIEQIRSTLPEVEKKDDTLSDDFDEFDWGTHNKGELLFIKGFNAISIVPPKGVKPRKVVQIISASNATITDALGDFDLDCCCVAYDGTKVLAMPRAVRSLALGDWTSGVNLLDTRLSRKLDPASGTVASRAVKYKSRGFGLALPPAAVDALEAKKVDFSAVLSKGKAEAAKERPEVRNEDLKGIAILLQREVNAKKEGRTRAQLHADYGPTPVPYWKLLESTDLTYENGEIQHSYAEFNVELGRKIISLMAVADKGSIIKSAIPHDDYLATWAIPYVASFDDKLILGLKDLKEVKEEYFFSHIQNQQLVAKVPRSLLPIADLAQKQLNKITAAAAGSGAGPSSKKAKTVADAPAILTEIEQVAINDALSALKVLSINPPPVPTRILDLSDDAVVPESLPGPLRSAYGRQVLPSKGGKIVDSLVGKTGQAEGECKKLLPTTYVVCTLAGLLQFRGLDAEIDRVKDAAWQAWCITARAAVSLPQDMPFMLEDFVEYHPDGKEIKARYKAQPSAKAVLNRMETELAALEAVVKKSGEGVAKRAQMGEWDGDRKRWLEQWIKGVEMV